MDDSICEFAVNELAQSMDLQDWDFDHRFLLMVEFRPVR